MAEAKVKITWHTRLEKFASDEERLLGKALETIEWETDEMVPPDVARTLGFDINKREEVTEHGTNNRG